MTMTMDLSSMIDDLIREADIAAMPAWTGLEARLYTDYRHPDELIAAHKHWTYVSTRRGLKLWHNGFNEDMTIEGHDFRYLEADLRCNRWAHAPHPRAVSAELPECQCVGDWMALAVCTVCAWHHIGTQAGAVEAWHDHAFPGWRDLPVLPAKLRGKMGTAGMTPKLEAWLDANYPEHFRVPGAPIRTERGTIGTRHVPGYSPFGGYDMSATTRDAS